MSGFCEDTALRDSFFQGQVEPRAVGNEIKFMDWTHDTTRPGRESIYQREQDLEGNPPLRVIFAPLDLPGNSALRPLFERYKVPAAFLSERLHSVTYGSGCQITSDGFYTSWCHYLSKSIDVAPDPDLCPHSLQVVDPRRTNVNRPVDQSNWVWLRGGFVLHWAPLTTQQTAESRDELQPVTLICFGGPLSLIERFRGLLNHPGWQTTVQDPYGLFVILFQEIFKQMNQQAWNLADVFRSVENSTLEKAAETNTTTTRYDFVGLYNIAKHCTYLREGFDAVEELLTDINGQHQRAQLTIDALGRDSIKYMLMHEQALFKSANFRVKSLNTRIESIISLSFNLVTQQDSRVMWQDNQTMKAIAFITLLFLPMATVATFFGCQFFGLDTTTSPVTFHVSPQIWIFFACCAVVMMIMFPMWRWAQVGAEVLTKPPSKPSDPKEKRKGKRKGLPWGLSWRSARTMDRAVELR